MFVSASLLVNTAVWPLFDPGVVVVLRIEIVVEFALPIVFTLFCQSTVHFWRLMQVETQNTGLDIKYNIRKAGLLGCFR